MLIDLMVVMELCCLVLNVFTMPYSNHRLSNVIKQVI